MHNRVKDIRKRLKLTQGEFSKRIGIGGSALSKIELNETVLTEQNIKLICKEFNVNEKWLRTGEGCVFLPGALSSEQELLEMYRELLPVNQRLVLNHQRELLAAQRELLGMANSASPLKV
jgi:transcriptional regulator with XRE-family HTH domain